MANKIVPAIMLNMKNLKFKVLMFKVARQQKNSQLMKGVKVSGNFKP